MKFNKVKYDNEYAKNNYDRIALNVAKGDKEKIKKHAIRKGYENITEYIKALIYQDMNGGVLKEKNSSLCVIYPQPRFSKCVSRSDALRTKKIYPSPYMTQVRGKEKVLP